MVNECMDPIGNKIEANKNNLDNLPEFGHVFNDVVPNYMARSIRSHSEKQTKKNISILASFC